jgi:uncharacterized protein
MNWLNLGILLAGTAVIGLTFDRSGRADEPLSVLILDGANPYHDWQVTTPLLRKLLEDSGRFRVDVATAPPKGEDMSAYRPKLADYDVLLSNYGDQRPWPEALQADFVRYVREGGGFVCFHSASNAFADWPEYNRICPLGGWYGRDERWGSYAYFRDGKLVRDESPGVTGHHGPQHEFQVVMRDQEHPITRGLPPVWLHSKDELYDSLRGKADDIQVLATAYSDPAYEGTGRDEPMLVVQNYGKGRVFQTMLGHADYSMRCVGFITTLLRGTEWAATGSVTIPVPKDLPMAESTSVRESD